MNIKSQKLKNGGLSFFARERRTIDGKPKEFHTTIHIENERNEKVALAKATIQATKECKAFFSGNDASTKHTFAWCVDSYLRDKSLAPLTRENYTYFATIVQPFIGDRLVQDISASTLNRMYKTLGKEDYCVRKKATANNLRSICMEANYTYENLAKLSCLSTTTISAAASGKTVCFSSAEKIAAALNLPLETVFTISESYVPYSSKTMNNCHKFVMTILNYFLPTSDFQDNLLKKVDVPKIEARVQRFLDADELVHFSNFLKDASDIRIKAVVGIFLFTGMRREELCGLSWQNIDLVKNVIQIRVASQRQQDKGIVDARLKSNRSLRDVPIPDILAAILLEYKQWWDTHCEFFKDTWNFTPEKLFLQRNGKPISPDTVSNWTKNLLNSAGFDGITAHGLRHSYVTFLSSNGYTANTISTITGHSGRTAQEVYSHPDLTHAKKVVDTVFNNFQ